MQITKRQRRGRSLLKRILYSQLYVRDSFMIMLGRTKPLVRFTVEDDPPSLGPVALIGFGVVFEYTKTTAGEVAGRVDMERITA